MPDLVRSVHVSLRESPPDQQFVVALISLIAAERWEDYHFWIRMLLCLRALGDEYRSIFLRASSQSSKFDAARDPKKWDTTATKGHIGIGTLHYYAREDSPTAYAELIKAYSTGDVELSVECDGAHFSIAKVLVSLMPGVIKNVDEVKTRFYNFDNHRWNRGGSTRMKLFLSSEVHALYAQLLCDAKDLLAQAKGKDAKQEAILQARVKTLTRICCDLKNHGFKDSVIKEVAILTYDPHFMDILDENHSLIGFDNGVYDLEAGAFRAGLPDDAVSLSTKYDFATEDDTEIQQQIHVFLDSCLESAEVKMYMLQVIASALYGRNVRERFFVFKGTGGNGDLPRGLQYLVPRSRTSSATIFPTIRKSALPNNLCSCSVPAVPPFSQQPESRLPKQFMFLLSAGSATVFPTTRKSAPAPEQSVSEVSAGSATVFPTIRKSAPAPEQSVFEVSAGSATVFPTTRKSAPAPEQSVSEVSAGSATVFPTTRKSAPAPEQFVSLLSAGSATVFPTTRKSAPAPEQSVSEVSAGSATVFPTIRKSAPAPEQSVFEVSAGSATVFPTTRKSAPAPEQSVSEVSAGSATVFPTTRKSAPAPEQFVSLLSAGSATVFPTSKRVCDVGKCHRSEGLSVAMQAKVFCLIFSKRHLEVTMGLLTLSSSQRPRATVDRQHLSSLTRRARGLSWHQSRTTMRSSKSSG